MGAFEVSSKSRAEICSSAAWSSAGLTDESAGVEIGFSMFAMYSIACFKLHTTWLASLTGILPRTLVRSASLQTAAMMVRSGKSFRRCLQRTATWRVAWGGTPEMQTTVGRAVEIAFTRSLVEIL